MPNFLTRLIGKKPAVPTRTPLPTPEDYWLNLYARVSPPFLLLPFSQNLFDLTFSDIRGGMPSGEAIAKHLSISGLPEERTNLLEHQLKTYYPNVTIIDVLDFVVGFWFLLQLLQWAYLKAGIGQQTDPMINAQHGMPPDRREYLRSLLEKVPQHVSQKQQDEFGRLQVTRFVEALGISHRRTMFYEGARAAATTWEAYSQVLDKHLKGELA